MTWRVVEKNQILTLTVLRILHMSHREEAVESAEKIAHFVHILKLVISGDQLNAMMMPSKLRAGWETTDQLLFCAFHAWTKVPDQADMESYVMLRTSQQVVHQTFTFQRTMCSTTPTELTSLTTQSWALAKSAVSLLQSVKI